MLKILHLEDDPSDALLVRRSLQASTLAADITLVTSRQQFLTALADSPWDVVLADQSVPSFNGTDAIAAVQTHRAGTPLIVLSGAGEEAQVLRSLHAGAADYVLKDHLPQLIIAIHRVTHARPRV